MQPLSRALSRVSLSPSIAVQTRALELRAAGRDVIALSAGEPDFDTPAHIRDAAVLAISEGKTRYTAVDGIPELKRAIAASIERQHGLPFGVGQVSVSAGGKQAIFNAFAATLDPGDEVLVPAPYWVSYPDMATLAGGTPRIVCTDPARGFKLDAARLEASITPQTRWLVLNSPSNPTGAVYHATELEALAEVLRHHSRVAVLCDDIYEHIVYAPARFATLAAIAPDLAPRILLVSGVSKTWAMTGWRIGYAAGPSELIDAMRTVQSQSSGNPCSISQWAALAALTGPTDFIETSRETFRRRRDLVVDALDATPGIRCARPDGAFYVFPDVREYLDTATAAGRHLNNDGDFAAALLEEQGVALVPGSAYGVAGFVRISFAAADDDLLTACERIGAFCRGLKRGA